jgi:hypothetical protein
LLGGKPTKAEDAVFALKSDVNSRFEVVGAECWDSDTKVNIHAIFELLRCPLGDPFADVLGLRLKAWLFFSVNRTFFDPLRRHLCFDNSMDIYAR